MERYGSQTSLNSSLNLGSDVPDSPRTVTGRLGSSLSLGSDVPDSPRTVTGRLGSSSGGAGIQGVIQGLQSKSSQTHVESHWTYLSSQTQAESHWTLMSSQSHWTHMDFHRITIYT